MPSLETSDGSNALKPFVLMIRLFANITAGHIIILSFFSLIFILNLLTELEFFKELKVSFFYPLYLSLINTPMLVFEMLPFIFLISISNLIFICFFTARNKNKKIPKAKNSPIDSALGDSPLHVFPLILESWLIARLLRPK